MTLGTPSGEAPTTERRSVSEPAEQPDDGAPRTWRRRLPASPWDVVLLGLVLLHLAVKTAVYWRIMDVPPRGDENTYIRAALTVAGVIRDTPSWSQEDLVAIQDTVVRQGWFLPGVTAILTPLYTVLPEAGTAVLRAYIGVVTTLLLLVTTLVVRRVIGVRAACAMVLALTCLPLWVAYSLTAWGDASAGLVAVILLALTFRIGKRLVDGESLRPRDGAVLGLAAVAMLYLRSSALPLVAGVFVLVGLGVLLLLRGPALRRSVVSVVVGGALFAGLLAPWSVFASTTLGGPVITTTTVPISKARAFGSYDELCFGPCKPGNIWHSMVNHSRREAAERGVSELEVQREMADYALRNVTPGRYAAQVLDNMSRYYLQPTGYATKFEVKLSKRDKTKVNRAAVRPSNRLTIVAYFAGLALLAGAVLTVSRGPLESRLLSILLKLFTAALSVQPFVHISSPRYWPIFAPLFGLAAVLLWSQLVSRNDPAPELSDATGRRERVVLTTLYWVQVALVAGFVAVFVGLLALSR